MSDFLTKKLKAEHKRRHRARMRVRSRVQGTPERPRLSVYKSLRYIYAQVIDDLNGRTVAQANSREAGIYDGKGSRKSLEAAKAVGVKLAERAKEQGVGEVVFDRAGFIYHGRIRAVADGARGQGLKF